MSDQPDAEMEQKVLLCIRCEEETTLLTSYSSGRNAMRRICSSCSATDRCLSRMSAKPKDKGNESEDQRKARKTAEELKASVNKMSNSERVSWYRQEKRKRLSETKRSKRTFSTAVGSLEETRGHENKDADLTKYMTMRDWCAREMSLKLYATFEDAQRGFEEACCKADAQTKTINGEVCLKENAGGLEEVASIHGVTGAVRQRADLGDGDQLDGFYEELEPRLKRARAKLDLERTMAAEDGGAERKYVPAVAVRKDLEAEQQLQEKRSTEFTEMAAQIKERNEAKKKEQKEKASQQTPSLSLAKLSMANAITKAGASMHEVLKRQTQTLESLAKEMATVLAQEDSASKTDGDRLRAEVGEAVARLEQKMKEDIEMWTAKSKESSHTGESLTQLEKDLAASMREWHLNVEELKQVKKHMKNLREHVNECKKEHRKKGKLAKKQAIKPSGKKAGTAPLPPTAETHPLLDKLRAALMEEDLGDKSWGFSSDALDLAKLPVKTPAATFSALTECCLKHEYYKQQKEWVAEVRARNLQKYSCALVTRDGVSRHLMSMAEKCLDESCRPVPKPTNGDLAELWQMYFYQCETGGARVSCATDWGLPDFRLTLEGTEIFMGYEVKSAVTSQELLGHLEKMTGKEFLQHVSRQGWVIQQEAGQGCILPAGHVFLQINSGSCDVHGARFHILSEAHLRTAAAFLEKQVAADKALETKRTGSLLKWIRER